MINITKIEAAEELERVSKVCTTTNLSIAAIMGANALRMEAAEQTASALCGQWVGGELGHCSVCGHEGCASDIWSGCKQTRCPNCGTLLEVRTLLHNCSNCRHEDRMPNTYPCKDCVGKYSDAPSNWEPKEVDNGQMD